MKATTKRLRALYRDKSKHILYFVLHILNPVSTGWEVMHEWTPAERQASAPIALARSFRAIHLLADKRPIRPVLTPPSKSIPRIREAWTSIVADLKSLELNWSRLTKPVLWVELATKVKDNPAFNDLRDEAQHAFDPHCFARFLSYTVYPTKTSKASPHSRSGHPNPQTSADTPTVAGATPEPLQTTDRPSSSTTPVSSLVASVSASVSAHSKTSNRSVFTSLTKRTRKTDPPKPSRPKRQRTIPIRFQEHE
jgi:hypothetical protein